MAVLREVYKNPAVLPYLGKAKAVLPGSPTGLQINGSELKWTGPANAYFAVYRSNGAGKTATVIAVTREMKQTLPQTGTYFVTAVSKKDNAESEPSQEISYK